MLAPGKLVSSAYQQLACAYLQPLSYSKKPGVSISPGLQSVPGRDTQTDRQTDRIALVGMRLVLRAVACEKLYFLQFRLLLFINIKTYLKLNIN